MARQYRTILHHAHRELLYVFACCDIEYVPSISSSTVLIVVVVVDSHIQRIFKEKQNAPRPSEHTPVRGGKMSKRLGGIKGCK